MVWDATNTGKMCVLKLCICMWKTFGKFCTDKNIHC